MANFIIIIILMVNSNFIPRLIITLHSIFTLHFIITIIKGLVIVIRHFPHFVLQRTFSYLLLNCGVILIIQVHYFLH